MEKVKMKISEAIDRCDDLLEEVIREGIKDELNHTDDIDSISRKLAEEFKSHQTD